MSTKKHTLVLFAFVVAKFILQFVLINPVYDLHRDEYLHLDQANHLAWGYTSVPPMSSWIAWLIKLLGNGVFWVKFFPALFGALTIVVVWKIVEALKGNLFACMLASLGILLSVILRINILFQPNSTDIFFWTLFYFVIVKYVLTESKDYIYAAAIVFAIGMQSKYNIAFLGMGLLPSILLTRYRKIFLDKNLYTAAGIGLVIMLPNLLWQYNNHFPTYYQLKELASTQLVNVNRADFLKEQLLFFISSFFIILAAFLGYFFYWPFKNFRLLFFNYVFTILIFMYFKAKGYYAIGLYPVHLAFGAVCLAHVFNDGWKKQLRWISIVIMLGLSIPFFMIGFPTKHPAAIKQSPGLYKSFGLLRWEDGREHELPQDFADMMGWKDIASIADSAYKLSADPAHTLVLCDNYGQAGAINYYSSFKHINAVSYNADYIYWINLDEPIKNVILIKDIYDEDPTREKEKPLFESIRLVGTNNNEFSREKGTKVYLLQNATADINALIERDISEYKK